MPDARPPECPPARPPECSPKPTPPKPTRHPNGMEWFNKSNQKKKKSAFCRDAPRLIVRRAGKVKGEACVVECVWISRGFSFDVQCEQRSGSLPPCVSGSVAANACSRRRSRVCARRGGEPRRGYVSECERRKGKGVCSFCTSNSSVLSSPCPPVLLLSGRQPVMRMEARAA